MVLVPTQLQKPDIRFVLLGKWDVWARYENVNGKPKIVERRTFKPEEYAQINQEIWKPLGKAPYETAWQKKDYSFESIELHNHLTNFGVIGGYGRLRILDIDEPSLVEEMNKKIGKTYTVKTGSGGRHFYFFSDYETNHAFAGKGELRAKNYQVVSAPSRHPNGNYYEVFDDSPIKELSAEKVAEIIKPFLSSEQDKQNEITEKPKDTSRSGEEMSVLCKMILKGFSKEQCYDRMNIFTRWATSPQAYRDKTYENAIEFVYSVLKKRKENNQTDETELTKAEEENWKEAFYFDKDLKNYQRQADEYFVENLIPKSSIGLICGYSGVRKTYFMLGITLACASGKNFLENYAVKNKLKVLIVDEENGKDEIDKRTKAIKKGFGISEDDLEIAYISFFNSKFDVPQKQSRLNSCIEEFKPDIIFVDCLQRAVTFDVDRENQKISEFMTGFVRPIINKHKCSIVFLHHFRKRDKATKFVNYIDEIRGGTELRNYCRFIFGLVRVGREMEGAEDRIILKQLKMANAPAVSDKVISFSGNVNGGESLVIKYVGEAEDILATDILCADAIMQWLNEEGIISFTTKQIQDAEPSNYKKTTISQGLNVLVQQNKIVKIKRGCYELVGKTPQTKITQKEVEEFSAEEVKI